LQVAENGRRVLIGWVQDDPRDQDVAASQSLSRDLSLSDDYELLQAFVPEYQQLRQPATFEQTSVVAEADSSSRSSSSSSSSSTVVTAHSVGSMQIEILATFTFTTIPTHLFGITALGGAAEIMVDCANKTIRNMVRKRSLLITGRFLLNNDHLPRPAQLQKR
jgi:sucrose-6-phosphate hydrolase SacC (GH32 family)